MRITSAIAATALALAGIAGPAAAQEFDLFGMADTSKDGSVSLEEFAAFQEQGWSFFSQGGESVKVSELQPMMQGAFVGITPDADGVVTHAVYSAATPAKFKAADKDGNGSLSKEELTALFPPPPGA